MKRIVLCTLLTLLVALAIGYVPAGWAPVTSGTSAAWPTHLFTAIIFGGWAVALLAIAIVTVRVIRRAHPAQPYGLFLLDIVFPAAWNVLLFFLFNRHLNPQHIILVHAGMVLLLVISYLFAFTSLKPIRAGRWHLLPVMP